MDFSRRHPDVRIGLELSDNPIRLKPSAWDIVIHIGELHSQPFQKLTTEAQQTSDVAKRTKLYEQAQEVFHQQVPWVPIDYSTDFMPMSTKVHGYKIQPTGVHVFYGVSLQ